MFEEALGTATFNTDFHKIASFGCLGCPNYSSCRELKSYENKLEDANAEINSDLPKSNIKRIRVLLDHLHRQKFLFPFSSDYRACWYHDKFGVIQNLIDYAQRLMRDKVA